MVSEARKSDRTKRISAKRLEVKESWFLAAFLVLFGATAVWAGEPKKAFSVKYISTDHVYLSGGTAQGLAVGDGLIIMGKGRIKASLEVDFTAEHSASCEVLQREGEIRIGDVAIKAEEIGKLANPRAPAAPPPTEPSPVRPRAFGARRLASVSGTFSAVYYNWNDNSPSGLDFSQSSARLNLKAHRLWDKEITFTLRARGRYDRRSRAYSSTVPQNEWVRNINELSFAFGGEKSRVNLYAGRIFPQRVSTVGYLDGALLEKRFSDFFRAGVFGGVQPEFMYTDVGTALNKGGLYINYARGSYQASRLELTLAAAASYHGSHVSREFLFLQAYGGLGKHVSIGQNVEVDYNRSWRREKMGRMFSLSSLYSFARFRINEQFSASLNYDRGRNYWTYETQSIADSLFDRRQREGLRLQLDFDRLSKYYGFAGAGARRRSGDARPTYTYTAGITRRELFTRHTSLNALAAAFSGPLQNGYNFSIRADQYVFGNNYASAGWGLYAYQGSGNASRRVNHAFDFSLRVDLAYRLFFSGQLQYSSGDDIQGSRFQGEIGYYF